MGGWVGGWLGGWVDGWVGGWEGGRYPFELKNPRFPFHVFWKLLMPYSRCPRTDKTDLKDLSARDVSKIYDFLYSENPKT